MQDAQQQPLPFARSSRDARIDALRVSSRVKALYKAVDRIALMLIEAGSDSAFVDDGQTLVAEIRIGQLAQMMNVVDKTVRRAIADARGAPHLDVSEATGKPSVFCLNWQAIPQVSGGTPSGVRGDTPQNTVKQDPGQTPDSSPHETHEFENQRFNTQNSIEGAGVRGDILQRARRWAWTREQLADASFVDLVIVPAAIARFRIPDSEQDRLGLQAAACCAVSRGKAPGAMFTDLVKRRAWTSRGVRGVAERWFAAAAALRASGSERDAYADGLQAENDEARALDRRKREWVAALAEFEREMQQRSEEPAAS